jgi:regulator of PEP synthase PpsR (kinase-PPPase family)
MPRSSPVLFHLHLLSDATGETLTAVAKAAVAQFERARPIEHLYTLVRAERQLERVLEEIEANPGIVFYTLMKDELREILEKRCTALDIPHIAVLDPALETLALHLGLESSHKPGVQHTLDRRYFERIEALNFAIAHDDGQGTDDLDRADVVLVGVSRTSKTPTSIYLAHRGIRAANVPIVPGIPLPENLFRLTRPLVVGLTASPDRLIQVRRNRLLALREERDTTYVSLEQVRAETIEARKIFARQGWPVIDVTRRSVEEAAAAILNLLNMRNGGAVDAVAGPAGNEVRTP